MIHHYSRGEFGNGYAICLRCGYAESEAAVEREGDKLTRAFETHHRLRGKGACDGPSRLHSVKRRVSLGATSRTDVVEIQLLNPSTAVDLGSRKAMTSLAVALREALARKLGVDSREIGWRVGASQGADQQRHRSIMLFDDTDGGAGYVASAGPNLAELLREAREILHCPQECDAACHACLLSYDTQDEVDDLDRQAALQALSDDLLDSLQLPAALACFGAETKLETFGVMSALRSFSRRCGIDRIRIYLGGPAEDWELEDGELTEFIQAMAAREETRIEVCVAMSSYEGMDHQETRALSRLAAGWGAQLSLASGDGARAGAGWLLAEVQGGTKCTRWAASAVCATLPGPDWASPSPRTEAPELPRFVLEERTGELPPADRTLVEYADFEKPIPGETVAIAVRGEFDGPVASLGERFWKLLASEAPRLRKKLEGAAPLLWVSYTDKFLRAPYLVRCLHSVLARLPEYSGGLGEDTRVRVLTKPAYSTHFVNRHGWPVRDFDRPNQQKAVLTEALRTLSANAEASLEAQVHWRELVLTWADGESWRIRLDQGLGFLHYDSTSGTGLPQMVAGHGASELLQAHFDIAARSPASPDEPSTWIYVSGANGD